MYKYFAFILCFFIAISCNSQQDKGASGQKEKEEIKISEITFPEGEVEPIQKTEEEWKSQLSESAYYVLRNKGTERPFTSILLKNKAEGIYVCAACQLPLFRSDTKFKSGTGWPSFYEPYNEFVVTEITDNSHGMSRVEVVCSRCEGHLGHVFEDGPEPTGLRYCINGVSLDFVKADSEK